MVELVGESFQSEDGLRDMDSHNTHRCCGLRIWLVKDVCGIICAAFTYWLMIFAQYVVLVGLIDVRLIIASTAILALG